MQGTCASSAKVLDVGELEPFGPYIVMEYLEGKSLAELLEARLTDQQGPIARERVVEYLLQACEALAQHTPSASFTGT